jgi:hypothetical protein
VSSATNLWTSFSKTSGAVHAKIWSLTNLVDVPGRLVLGCRVLVGMKVQHSSFEAPITKTGFVDFHAKDQYASATIG